MMMMRTITTFLLVCAAGGLLHAADDPAKLSTDKEKISYLIGRQMGESLVSQELADEVDPGPLTQGIREALAGKELALPEAEAGEILQAFSNRMREKMTAKRDSAGAQNRAEGERFLAENIEKQDWSETDSGLQYKVLEEGKGPKPSLDDVVEVHYQGMLLDGEEFDSSYARGEPAVFPLGRVIKGWQEALQMMKVGAKWDIVIPADLAYGSQGKGPKIGPDAVLRFQVELLDIKQED